MLKLTFVSVLISCQCGLLQPKSINDESILDELNEFLIDNVPNNDLALNLAAANKLFKIKTNQLMGVFKPRQFEQLRLFAQMDTVVGEQSVECGQYGYLVLKRVDEWLGLRAQMGNSKEAPLRRTDNVAYQALLEHARNCFFRAYPANYRERRALMNETLAGRAESVPIDRITAHPLVPRGLSYYHLTYVPLASSAGPIARLAHETLERALNQTNHPDRVFLRKVVDQRKGANEIRADKFGQLFDEYLAEPCKYYAANLGRAVFVPAEYDAWALRSAAPALDLYRPELDDFYKGWACYRVCDELVNSGQLAGRAIGHASKLGAR